MFPNFVRLSDCERVNKGRRGPSCWSVHKYAGCDLVSGLEGLPPWWIFLAIFTALYRDHICLIPYCWWSCFARNSLSRLFPPSVKRQSPVKVDVITPLLCNKTVSSFVVCSRFLDVCHSHKKVEWSIHNSGSSSSICPSVKSFPFLGICSLHYFSAPISLTL